MRSEGEVLFVHSILGHGVHHTVFTLLQLKDMSAVSGFVVYLLFVCTVGASRISGFMLYCVF